MYRCIKYRSQIRRTGMTLIELLIAISLGAILMLGLNNLLSQALLTHRSTVGKRELLQQAHYAIKRIAHNAQRSSHLMLPLADNPKTSNQNESIHYALAIRLPTHYDRDQDGFSDADNDRDGLIDEDIPNDMTNDGAAGIVGIDDDMSGTIDGINANNDDEDDSTNEEIYNGLDDDGDGLIDEDLANDMNKDGFSGIALVDDNHNEQIDEGNRRDDDEDGLNDEDWLDALVYYQSNSLLIERFPKPHGTGLEYTEAPLADGIESFTVTRLKGGLYNRVKIVLVVTNNQGESTMVSQTIRIGSRL